MTSLLQGLVHGARKIRFLGDSRMGHVIFVCLLQINYSILFWLAGVIIHKVVSMKGLMYVIF